MSDEAAFRARVGFMRNAAFFVLLSALYILTTAAGGIIADEMPDAEAVAVYKTDVTPENYKYEIGGAGGLTSGVGLSFRSWNTQRGIQYTFCPVFNGSTGSVFISAGILKMYSIYINPFSNLYVYGGGSFFILNSQRYDNVTENKTATLKETGRYHLNAGIGTGIEFF
jgi:hypothetical protein